jgi:hypothetical protein
MTEHSPDIEIYIMKAEPVAAGCTATATANPERKRRKPPLASTDRWQQYGHFPE